MALATNALTTISTVETELSLTAAAQDAELTRYIDTASDQIERYVNRKLYYGSAIVEKVAGSGDAFLWISRTPLSSVTSVVWLGDSSTVTGSTYEIWEADQGSIYRSAGWNDTKISATATDNTRYQVTYVGGWITPQQDADDGALTRDLPWDLETACVDLVTAMWRMKGTDRTLRGEAIMNTRVDYDFVTRRQGIPESIQAILDTYKRMDRLEMVG